MIKYKMSAEKNVLERHTVLHFWKGHLKMFFKEKNLLVFFVCTNSWEHKMFTYLQYKDIIFTDIFI